MWPSTDAKWLKTKSQSLASIFAKPADVFFPSGRACTQHSRGNFVLEIRRHRYNIPYYDYDRRDAGLIPAAPCGGIGRRYRFRRYCRRAGTQCAPRGGTHVNAWRFAYHHRGEQASTGPVTVFESLSRRRFVSTHSCGLPKAARAALRKRPACASAPRPKRRLCRAVWRVLIYMRKGAVVSTYVKLASNYV